MAGLEVQGCSGSEQPSIFPTATFVSAMLVLNDQGKGKVNSSRMFRRHQNAKEEQRLRLSSSAKSVVGALVCGVGAGAASVVGASHQWRALVPLAFTIVLLLIALLFGSRAGILGTVLAATIFAMFLFQPLGNLSIMDDSARSNLAWMLLIGVSFSFLFAPPTSGLHRH